MGSWAWTAEGGSHGKLEEGSHKDRAGWKDLWPL